jgi:hypothetical protein
MAKRADGLSTSALTTVKAHNQTGGQAGGWINNEPLVM